MKIHRLKQVGYKELYVRGSQFFSAFAERQGWSSLIKTPTDDSLLRKLEPATSGGRISSDQEYLEYFRKRNVPTFFGSFLDPESTIGLLRQRWPTAERAISQQAKRITQNRFDLLGLEGLDFGSPINWHLEPISGKQVPLWHWSQLDYLDPTVAGDKKIVWELNRNQYFVMLGQAYWLSNDELFAKTFVDHINSWMDQNPPKLGINWASSLEVAFRSISWLWALYFFRDSPSLTPEIFFRIIKFLYLNARHLETYLSTYFSPNTHLTGEALGLFYLGTVLPEFKEATRWRDTGEQILIEQLPLHVLPDGVYVEKSTYYHRYTTDFYSHFLILSQINNRSVPNAVYDKLGLLMDHLMYITKPDGTTPLFGDDDGGRLVMLERRPANDFRSVLSTGAALFGRGDYKCVAADAAEETLWLLGPKGIQDFDQLDSEEPEKRSAAFPDGGYYVMRDGWSGDANYLLFDCGSHGYLNCGHAHADALSFELAVGGQTILVDPGTYTYTGSKELRDWFRTSQAHNTLTVDNQSSSVPGGPFSWQSIAHAQVLRWISEDRFDFVEASHDGYSRLPKSVNYARSILFLKHDYWIMRDQVAADCEYTSQLWFHFRSGAISPTIMNPSSVELAMDSKMRLQITSFAHNGQWKRKEGWFSESYGRIKPAAVLAYYANLKEREDVITFLSWPKRSGDSASIKQVEATDGMAFEICSHTGLDVLMIRTGSRIQTTRLTSDFEWVWTRFCPNDGVLLELVLIGGQMLELNGREILKGRRRLEYVMGRRHKGKFLLETDGSSDVMLFEN